MGKSGCNNNLKLMSNKDFNLTFCIISPLIIYDYNNNKVTPSNDENSLNLQVVFPVILLYRTTKYTFTLFNTSLFSYRKASLLCKKTWKSEYRQRRRRGRMRSPTNLVVPTSFVLACLGTPDALRGEPKPDLVQLAMRGGMMLGQPALRESKIKARERIDEWEGMIRVEKWTMDDEAVCRMRVWTGYE